MKEISIFSSNFPKKKRQISTFPKMLNYLFNIPIYIVCRVQFATFLYSCDYCCLIPGRVNDEDQLAFGKQVLTYYSFRLSKPRKVSTAHWLPIVIYQVKVSVSHSAGK